MDKASAYGAGDCRFESCRGHRHTYTYKHMGIHMYACGSSFRGSIVVSISACHAEDPGSIPGGGVYWLLPAYGSL